MTHSVRLTLCVIALAAGVSVANAQTNQDHTAHHPDGNPAAAAPANLSPDATVTPGSASPKMNPGTGGPGMGAMMGGGMSSMMGNMDQMMSMMRMMRGMMMPPSGSSARMEMMPTEHVEGRIAFLKTELRITEAQLPQWNSYAEALRAAAKTMQGAMAGMMGGGAKPATLPARMDAMVLMMTARLETLKTTAAAGKALYAALTDAQKKLADDLIMSPMGGM